MIGADAGRTLLVGGGLIGGQLARAMLDRGHYAVVAHRQPLADGVACDVSQAAGRAALRRHAGHFDSVVLAHGPSDVTWCETHEEEAYEVHVGTAAALADNSAALLLVSTDNVFSGRRPRPQPNDPVDPQNAYGRVKAAAEAEVLAAGGTVVRVSLVYGYRPYSSLRRNFVEECLDLARRHEAFQVPTDQRLAPVYAGDVATVMADIVERCPCSGGVFHLAGPDLLSRYDMSVLVYRLAGSSPDLVTGVPRAGTRWASRPQYSSLAIALPPPAGRRLRGVEQGLLSMLDDNAGGKGIDS